MDLEGDLGQLAHGAVEDAVQGVGDVVDGLLAVFQERGDGGNAEVTRPDLVSDLVGKYHMSDAI